MKAVQAEIAGISTHLNRTKFQVTLPMLLVGSSLMAANASAEGVLRNTTIDYLTTQGIGMLVVPKTVNGQGLAGQPSCVGGAWANILIIDSRTASGRMNIAVALMAHAQGKTVDLAGAGTCGTNGAAEDLGSIMVR